MKYNLLSIMSKNQKKFFTVFFSVSVVMCKINDGKF